MVNPFAKTTVEAKIALCHPIRILAEHVRQKKKGRNIYIVSLSNLETTLDIFRVCLTSSTRFSFFFPNISYDRVVNLAIGIGMCVLLAGVGRGAYQLVHGTGRKEGF